MASLSPLLHNFSADDIAQLSTFGESRHYNAGDTLIEEGADNRHLCLILRGSVEVLKKTERGVRRLAEIGVTGSLGEMSVFDPGPSSATVRAVTDVEVWLTTQDQLDRMHEIRPKVAYRLVCRISQVLSQRLRKLNEQIADVG